MGRMHIGNLACIKSFWGAFAALFLCFAPAGLHAAGAENKKSLVFVAGNSIHLWGDHENLLICRTLKDLLSHALPNVETRIVDVGGGDDLSKIGTPTAMIVVGEGEDNHPLRKSPQILSELSEKGVGIGVFHYALHFSDEKCYKYLDAAVGAHYEPYWSVNPFWKADFSVNGEHPVSRGVGSFSIDDEWYFNLRFTDDKNVKITPVLWAPPPDKARSGRFGPHSGNPTVRSQKGKKEVILWTLTRKDGSRGMGFSGGHSVWALAQPDLRKALVNAVAWLLCEDIPEGGFDTLAPSYEKLEASITKEARRDYESYSENWKEFFKKNAQRAPK